jgi:hypothetical protein
MNSIDTFFKKLYQNFNDRKIDAVIAHLQEDIKWANGMEGGYVYGQQAVKEYWTRQFSTVSSKVTPVKLDAAKDLVKIQVHQVVHDLDGKLLADEMVLHFFYLQNNKIAAFDIG